MYLVPTYCHFIISTMDKHKARRRTREWKAQRPAQQASVCSCRKVSRTGLIAKESSSRNLKTRRSHEGHLEKLFLTERGKCT